MRVLVAGVGNILRSDDAFGVEVIRRLDGTVADNVTVLETGIGGIALLQELQEGYDALVVVDVVDRGRPPGAVMLIEPEVVDVEDLPTAARHELLADAHLVTPERMMMMARALGVLPPRLLMVACQPHDAVKVGIGMSEPVTAAVDIAVEEIRRHLRELAAHDGGRAA